MAALLSPSSRALLLLVQVSSLALAPLASAQAAAAAITACPGAVANYAGAGDANYDICAGTDLQGTSAQIVANIASVTACAALCDANGACLKAVYDSTGKACHIKSNDEDALTWTASSARYTAIYFNNPLPETTDIAVCPYNETTYTYTTTSSYRTCVDTDIRGASAQMIDDVASTEACRDLCAAYSPTGCARAVYDKVAGVCHIKADAAANTLIWYTNKRYDVIRQQPAAAPNPAVEGVWSDLVRFPVIPVAAYIVPAFPQPSRMLVFSSWGDTEFGGAGGLTQFADYNFETYVFAVSEIFQLLTR